MNLRTKMMAAFVGIVMIPTIALIVLNDAMMSKSIRESYSHKGKDAVERTINYTFQKLARELGNYIAFTSNDATFVRAAYYLNEIDSDADMQVIGPEFKKRLGLSYLEVTNKDNIITYSTLPNRKGKTLKPDFQSQKLPPEKARKTQFSYNTDIREATIQTSAIIQWQDGEIGHLHGGYILNGEFLREIAGSETVFGAYFFDPSLLRSTKPIPLNPRQINQTIKNQMPNCIVSSMDTRPCQTPNYLIWDFVTDDGTPYLIVGGILHIPGGPPIGIVFEAEDAKTMYRDVARARITIISLGLAFILVGGLMSYFASGAIVKPIDRLTKELARLAETDQLTGARNRRAATNLFRIEASRAQRGKTSFGVLLFDIDYFKRINDTYGHPVGDEVLKHIVKLSESTLRDTDYCFRYGGEEFLVLLPILYDHPIDEANREQLELTSAMAAAEHLRNAIKNSSFLCEGKLIEITISIGISIFPTHGTSYEKLLGYADKALYQAKNEGRDRAVVYDAGNSSSTANQ